MAVVFSVTRFPAPGREPMSVQILGSLARMSENLLPQITSLNWLRRLLCVRIRGNNDLRTTRTTISYMQPFKLRDLDDIQPAGDYLLDMDDDRRPAEAGPRAYRNISTFAIHVSSAKRAELISVKPAELDVALEKDRIGRAL